MTRRRRLTSPANPASIADLPDQDFEWISNQQDFERVVDKASKAQRVALDTEFHRERTYWPSVALVQIRVGGETFLVDPTEVDLSSFASVLASETTFVMHAALQDIEVLERVCGTGPQQIFDTQIAAGFLGMTTPSLSALVERYLGLRLPKGDRITDWFERPLRLNQREYAANDVRYLFELHDALMADLEGLGRKDWAQDECDLLIRKVKPGVSPELAWTRIKEARHLRGRSKAIAAVIAEWREETAQRRNVPTRFVLSDLAVVGIAQRAPSRATELKSIRGLDGRSLKDTSGQEILDLVSKGMSLDPTQIATLEPEESPQLEKEMRAAVTLVSAWIAQVAKNEDLDPALLGTRSDISDLLRGVPTARLGAGWRSDLVGNHVRDLVAGKAALAFDAHQGLVLEERFSSKNQDNENFKP